MTSTLDKLRNAFTRGPPAHAEVVDVLAVKWTACRDDTEREESYSGWSVAGSTLHKLTVGGATHDVQPVRFFRREQILTLDVTFGAKTADLVPDSIVVEIQDKVLAVTRVVVPSASGMGPSVAYLLSFRIGALFDAVGSTINRNALSAKVTFTDAKGATHVATTAKCIHVMLQKALVLLPGVMASELHFTGKIGPNWPSPADTGDRLRHAACRDDGDPVHPTSRLTVIKKPGSRGPYHINDWNTLLNATLPKLEKFVPRGINQLVPYITLHEYPYDWRRPCSQLVRTLLDDRPDVPLKDHDKVLAEFERRPTYTNEPSLAMVRKLLRTKFPYLDDKIAMAGHSTGGVILNGVIRTLGAQDIISHAFFIGTPFRGATKPYLVALRGTMLLGGFTESLVLDAAAMIQVGARLPVLYHLAPTIRYEGAVMKIVPKDPKDTVTYRAGDAADGAGHFVNRAKAAVRAKRAPYHHKDYDWSSALAAQAAAFHAVCEGELRIPEPCCTVFYSFFKKKTPDGRDSVGDKPCTLGPVVVKPAVLEPLDAIFKSVPKGEPLSPAEWDVVNGLLDRAYTYELIEGDGTVPRESLLGGRFAGDRYVRLGEATGDLDHVGITGSPQLWQRVREDIMRDLAARTAAPAPPVDAPRGDAPPPPDDKPPGDKPPGDKPPGDKPPGDKPSDSGSGAMPKHEPASQVAPSGPARPPTRVACTIECKEWAIAACGACEHPYCDYHLSRHPCPPPKR